MRRLFVSLLGLSLIFGFSGPAHAQVQARIDLFPPDAAAFPSISALMDVFDSRGVFASGLAPESVTVFEDGQPRPVAALDEMFVPAQITLAFNTGPGLDARDAQGLSRFQRVIQVLGGWAQTRPADPWDDLSLVSLAGPLISHAPPADFLASLNSFNPDFRNTIPNLQSLAIAIDTAAAQTRLNGMKRAVLFITPHMDDANIDSAIQPLIQRALDNDIRVFVWFIDADQFFVTTSAAAFNNLAIQSGGSLFAYSGLQPFPDPESYFAPLRSTYVLQYNSQISGSGQHTLSVEVQGPEGKLTSAEQTFSVEIQPPNPIMVQPTLQITRQAPADDPFNTERLLPETQTVDIIIEFPDGHPRPLVRTTLYVDGAIADENTAEPFDSFTWGLTGYSISGEHHLIVEAVDSLGLSKTSMDIPVTLTVIQPPRGLGAFLSKYRQQITIGAVSLAGLALLFVLLTGRFRIPSLRARQAARRISADPLTQPVAAPLEETAPSAPRKRAAKAAAEGGAAKPRRASTRKKAAVPAPVAVDAPASLVRLNPDGQPSAGDPLALTEKEVLFGTDLAQSTLVLEHASVSPLHARLKRTADDDFVLSDAGSVAGTWVNYEPVPPEGHRLQQGDVVHFGQLIYRFQVRTPVPARKPTVVPEKPIE
ncbi:MAG TPA: FHA domain-containing protein [Anaerolineales bacterium]|jgi:hypothetical protein